MENMPSQSDNTPLFSKKELREIRLLMNEYVNENEELRAKIIAMNQYVKKSEASLKKAKMYISQLEYTLAKYTTPSDN